jgi:hypothetical protein
MIALGVQLVRTGPGVARSARPARTGPTSRRVDMAGACPRHLAGTLPGNLAIPRPGLRHLPRMSDSGSKEPLS